MHCCVPAAIAHQEVARALEEDVHRPLQQYGADAREQYDRILTAGKIQQDLLTSANSAKEKAEARYHKACTEREQADVSVRPPASCRAGKDCI